MIVPSYGRAEALCATVQDILSQSVSPCEIHVVHQQPDIRQKATERLRTWAKEGLIRLHETDFANAQRARNLAIAQSKGEVVLLLDDDIRAPKDLIERHWINYQDDTSLDGVTGQVLQPGEVPTADFPNSFRWPHNGWQFFPLNYSKRMEVINWPSCNASVKRAVALKVGGFDEQFDRTLFDDSDFSWRLHQSGARIVFDPSATITHLRLPSGGNRPAGQGAYLWADRDAWSTAFYFWRKNFGLAKVWRHVWWYFRCVIFRRAVLVRPYWFVKNWICVAGGYRKAARKLAEGPRYIRDQEVHEAGV